MANKKKIPARALACLLSTAMVPGSLPMDVLTVYGAEAEEFSDGKTSEADITPLDADAVDDAVETADFSSGSEVTADVVSEEASVDVQSADPNFDYTLSETDKTLKVGDTGSVSGTAVLDGNAVTPTVTYASSNPAVVAVDPSTGFYNCLTEGTAAITATVKYTDSSNYTHQTVKTLNITVTKDAEPQLTVTVKQPTVSVELDAKADAVEAYDLKNNVIVENAAAVMYKLTDAVTGFDADPSAATVDTTGLVTFKKAGKYVAAVIADGTDSTGTLVQKTSQVIFDVTKKTAAADDFTYEINELQRTHTIGESGSAAGTAFLGSQAVQAGVVNYTSSDDSVVKVESDGTYKCLKAGTATVKVSATYNDTETGKSYARTINLVITVKDVDAPVVTANQTDVSLELDAIDGATAKYNLRSILSVENGDLSNVTYESSDKTNAKVETGTATFSKAGEYKVRAYIGSSSVTINFHITKKGVPAPIITANQTDVSLELDSADDAEVSYNLKSILSVENGLFANVKYESSDETNAKVELNGTATFKKAGEYTVRAYIESSSVTINFHITKKGVAAPTITANQTDVDIELGATETERVYNLKSILNLTDAEWTDVDIQSSDATNAEINSTDGTVKVKEAGEYTVKATVTTKGGSQSVTVNFHVTREAAAKPAITAKQKEVNITLASGKTVTYNLKANFTLSNLDWTDVDIQSSDATNAAVNPTEGTVTFSKVGYYTVTAVEKTSAATSDIIIFHVTSAVQEAGASISGGQDVPLSEIGDAFDADKTLTVKDFDGTELEHGKHGSAGVVWTSDNKAVATVTDGVIVAVSQGTAVITATLPNGNYTTYTVTVAPAQISTEISSFDVDLNDKNLDPEDYNLSTLLTAKNAGTNKIVYSDFNQNIIQVDDDGLVTFTGNTGTTYVRAQIENTDAYVIITFNVTNSATPDPITINYAPNALQNIEVKEGQAYEKNLRDFIEVKQGSDFTDLTNVTWSSNDDSVAKVDNGVVTGVKAGTAVITATTVDGYYVTFTVTVKNAMKLNATQTAFAVDLKDNKTVDLNTYLNITNPETKPGTTDEYTLNDVRYTTSTNEIAEVTGGKVTFKKTGLAEVKADLNGQTVTFTFIIKDTTAPLPVEINFKANAESTVEVAEGKVFDENLRDRVELTNGGDIRDITWTSLDESIASVSNGMVRGVKAGETTVIASTKDGYYVTFKVTVLAEPKMEVSQTEFDIDRAEQTSLDLKAYLKLLNTADKLDQDVNYTASADEIASVGPDGVVTFNGTGTTNVKAEYQGQVITFTFHITDSTTPDPITINYTADAKKQIEITEGEAYEKNLRDFIEVKQGSDFADITSVTWSSNDDSVAKVDGGVVTGLKPGTAVITATTVDGYYVTFTVKVNPKALANVALKAPGTNVINLTLDSAVNASKDLSELVESTTVPTADVKGFTWSSDNTDVAVVANGTVKAVNPGLAMVTVTAPDGSSVSFIVSVSAGSFDQTTLTADNLKQIVLQLNVTDKETAALPEIKSDGGVVTWKVLDTDIARIAGNKVEGLKAGHTVAVATAPDGSCVGVSVKVLAEPVVTVELTGQEEIPLKMGQDETHDLTKELTVDLIGGLTAPGLGGSAPAVGTNSLLSQLTWTCSDESVVKVYSGVAVAQSAGVAVVTATAPDGSMAVFTITVDAEDISSVQLKAGESNIVNLILDGSDAESYKDLAKLVEDASPVGADPATFNWVSADQTIATVSHGVVRAQAVGNTTVTVTAPDGSKVVFIVAVSAGGFKPGYEADWEAILQVGVADKMSKKLPTVEATAGKVTWSCADESIAKITGDSVTAVAPGITYVLAKAPNGSELAFKVTVYASPAISFDKDSVSVPTGEVVQANVTVDPEDAAVDYKVTLDGTPAAAGTDYTLSVNGKKISFVPLAAGRFVITATAEVNSETATAQLVVTAQQEVTKVAFTEDKRNLFVGDTDDLLSLIQWNDGLSTPYDTSLTWSTGNASVATVDDTGVVTATGVGRTYVYAKASNGLRAKILVIVDAKVEGVTLSQENYELWVNEIAFIKATPNPANAKYTKVKYTSDDDTIATVSTDGRIVAKKGGTTYITATITWTDADGNNQTASARAKVFVKTPVESVEVRRVDTDTNADVYAKKRGETIQLKAVITPAEAYDKALTWSSENEAVATVDQNGKVTTVGKGTTYIYAKCMNGTYGTDGNGTPAVGMIKIIVGAKDDIQLDITPTRSEVYPGENVQYTTTLTPEEAYAGELTWSSDNPDVVIDSTGVAMVSKTAKAGLANITATMTFADGITKKTAKALLYIKTDVNSLKFEKDAMTIYLDEDDYLSPIFNDGATTPSDTSITWTSDDSSIVSVDSYGKIHANKLGTTWISAYSYNKLRAQMLVKVIAAPTGVKLSEEVISGFAGEKHDIGYTFTPDYTTETGVTWSTNNADVAYYDTYTNKIVMKGAGSCWITITANDTHHGVITDKVKVNVRQKVTGVTISDKKLTKKVGNMFKMTATAIPANGVGSTIFWSSSRPQVATVDEFGVVTCLKAGTTMITAITANGHVAKCYLRVKPGKKVYTVKYGVTTASALFVRNSASLQGIQIGQLGRGTAVTIVDTVDEWYKIKFNGGYGYVRAAYVKITSGALTKRTAVKSNGQISTTTWIYTGVGTGANTVAPVATRVLITGETGNYYRVRYGTGSVGSGYVLKSCVRPDAGFKYGVATKTTYLGTGTATKKFSSTPQITVYRVARTTKRTGVYADATGKGKRIGVIQCKAKVVLNSAKINGYYQVVFTNGVTGYVPVKALKLLGAGIKSYVNTTNTYTKAYRK